MKIFNDVELIDLAIYTNKTLIVTDFHIGYEEALNKQGLLVPRFQFPEIIKRLDNVFKKLRNKTIDKIIVNGDIKHEFGTISEQEWRHTLKLLDYLGQHCKEIILVKGNHDTILGPIARKRNVEVVDYYLISPITKKPLKNRKNQNNGILIIHGDKIPNKDLLKQWNSTNPKIGGMSSAQKPPINWWNSERQKPLNVIANESMPPVSDGWFLTKSKIIIIGHEHPAVSIREGPRAELFKAYLVGKWKGKNLIVQPSFNLVTEGTDILKEEVLSPFLKSDLGTFNSIVVADKLYNFGLAKHHRNPTNSGLSSRVCSPYGLRSDFWDTRKI